MKKNEINFFAETTFRNRRKKFGIKLEDRRRHFYIVGKTGTGKTAMMKNMIIQDIETGKGVGFIDPHGEAAEDLLDFVPSHRINDVVYFNPADLDYPIAFNVMEQVSIEQRHLVASGLLGVFKKIWPDVWSARMEYILSNTLLALLEYPGSTILGVNRMMADSEFRKKVLRKITDPVIKAFWTKEFARYSQQYAVEATAAIQNKIGQFISAPLIRNIVGQTKSSINMREIMDERRILIVNLAMGSIGEDVALLLGGLLITKIQLAAMSRADIPEGKREDFFLYVDEFQHFATRSFVNILSEARKYRLSLILSHQYIAQMEEEVSDAVFGNVGTLVSFRVGAEDAEYLEKEFAPQLYARHLVNLPQYNLYLKLMIDGIAGHPFSAETLPPFPKPAKSHKEKIIRVSRERYATERKKVEGKIEKWLGFFKNIEPPVPTVLYDVICSICGKKSKAPFKPDSTRPVYCRSCLKKIRKDEASIPSNGERKKREEIQKREGISLKEAVKKEPVCSSPPPIKKEKDKTNKKRDVKGMKEALAKALEKYQRDH